MLEYLNEDIKNIKYESIFCIPIIMFDKKMNVIQKFKSATEATNGTKFNNSGIGNCCNFKIITHSNYVWLKNDEHLENNIILKQKQLTGDNEYILHRIDNDGKIMETFNSAKEIEDKYETTISSILKVCSGRITNTKGYKFIKEYV